jgi:pyruvate formate lyase activating enzyme
MKAIVNKIIPFSSVDGPGNRTAVFLQGCNINCKYCHNPETRALCVQCGICVENCPAGALSIGPDGAILYDADRCVQCDTCISVCPSDSSPKTFLMSPEEVMEKVEKQIPFIRGVTVSGGECMLRPEFLEEFFRLCREKNLGTMIDSNGTVDFRNYPDLLSVTDGVMLDIKAFDAKEHIHVTGADNRTVLENAEFLAQQGKLFEVRCVIVPDLYDTEKSIRDMAAALAPLNSIRGFRIKLIAYRPMGVREEYSHFQVPTGEYLNYLAGILREQGFKDIIII